MSGPVRPRGMLPADGLQESPGSHADAGRDPKPDADGHGASQSDADTHTDTYIDPGTDSRAHGRTIMGDITINNMLT